MNANEIRDALFQQIDESFSPRAYLINGPTLIGKTWILEKWSLAFAQSDSALSLCVCCQQSMVGFEPLIQAVEALDQRQNWSRNKQGRFYVKTLAEAGTGILAWGVNKLYPSAVSRAEIDEVVGVIKRLIVSGNSTVASEFPRSETSKMLQLLDKTIARSGKRLVLLVDRVEELPVPGIRLLQALVEQGVKGCTVVISANNESQAINVRSDISDLMTVLIRRGQGVYNVAGYSPKELIDMRWANGHATSKEEANRAYEFSINGRIGLLLGWLDASQPTLANLKSDADRLRAHFRLEYDKLPEEGRTLVKCLAAVFPGALTVHHAAVCLGCTVTELEQRLKPVLSVFAVLGGDQIVLRSLHVLYFVASDVAHAYVVAAREEFAAKLHALAQTGQLQGPLEAVPQIPFAIQTMDVSSLLLSAQDDLRRGASAAAISRIRAWNAWGPKVALLEAAKLLKIEADALGQLGDYSEAIAKLNEIPAHSLPRAEVAIDLGEKYLRSGEYDRALESFREARRAAEANREVNLWVKAVARTQTARNDMRSKPPSRGLIDTLERVCNANSSVTDVVKCHALRTIARTLALIPGNAEAAVSRALAALEIAQNKTKSIRDQGNCFYALGDAYRHASETSRADDAYYRAHAIASETGNFDLELYCLLGIAANAIHAQNIMNLETALEKLGAIARAGTDEHVIYRLFTFVLNKMRLLPLSETPRVVISRPWTRDLLDAARVDGHDRGRRIAAVRITL